MNAICTHCGNDNLATASFCSACGSALTPTTPEGSTPSGWGTVAAGMNAGTAQTQIGSVDPTTETVFKENEFASWGQRLGAALLDSIILWVLFVAVAFAIDPQLADHLVVFDQEATPPDDILIRFGFILAVIILGSILWEILWIRLKMAKPGQMAAGFKVVNKHGEHVSTGQAIGRFFSKVIYNLSIFGIGFLGATGITIATSKRRQALHDMMCGSICVKNSALVRLDVEADSQFAASPVQQSPVSPIS